MRKLGRFWWIAGTAIAVALSTAAAPAVAANGPGGFSLRPAYQAGDFSRGRALFILPAGQNGVVNAAQPAQFDANGQRPPLSQDQLAPYQQLEFRYASLTDSPL